MALCFLIAVLLVAVILSAIELINQHNHVLSIYLFICAVGAYLAALPIAYGWMKSNLAGLFVTICLCAYALFSSWRVFRAPKHNVQK